MLLSTVGNVRHVRWTRRRQSLRCIRRVVLAGVASIAAVAILAVTLEAHDFWLIPDPFAVASGGTITVRGRSGIRFPESESAVPANRIIDARLIGAHGELRMTDFAAEGKSLRLRQKPSGDGEYIVSVSLEPRSTRTTPAGFSRYLKLEGAADEASRLEHDGAFAGSDSITYRASKFAKTIVEVGRGELRAFDKSAGHPLEFIPTTDPARAEVGDTIALRVVANGHPIATLRVHVGAAADSMLRVKGSTSDPDLHLLTDASGIVRVPLTKPGLWNVRAAHVLVLDAERGPDGIGRSDSAHLPQRAVYWATFVFNVPNSVAPRSARTSDVSGEVSLGKPEVAQGGDRQLTGPTASDSVDVVNTVKSFHAALAAGDSARALALLASDVIVLESGDFETREVYRSQHLAADIAFARTVTSSRRLLRVVVQGDVAWVASTTTIQGEFRGRTINSVGAEVMVLTRAPNGWQIRSIHWSSRAQRPR